ncbi:MAG: diguanylate cyclase [Campylobacterales bacterium]
MNLAEIVRVTLKRLKAEGSTMTPDEYSRVFCEEAKKAGVTLPECQKVAQLLSKLDPSVVRLLRNYVVRTPDELVQFLGSRLARELSAHREELLVAWRQLVARLLKALTLLHDAEAVALATTTASRIQRADLSILAQSSDEWESFVKRYNDVFLMKLAGFGKIRTHDLKMMVDDLAAWLEHNNPQLYAATLAPLMLEALKPVISLEPDDELKALSDQLTKTPRAILTEQTQEQIGKFIQRRALLERKKLRDELKVLEQIVDVIQGRIKEQVISTNETKEGLGQIKSEVMRLSHSDMANKELFTDLQQRLLGIIDVIEGRQRFMVDSLSDSDKETRELQKRIKELESELEEVRREAEIDFMTKLYNRRGIERHFERMVAQSERDGSDFSIVLLDLDRFKQINDTYGHEAGDVVIKSFAQIIQRTLRAGDFAGRWGGEEFVVILPSTREKEAMEVAERLREAVEHTRFIYKDTRIPVTASGGVSSYGRYKNIELALAATDRLLYQAKTEGRNRIIGEP